MKQWRNSGERTAVLERECEEFASKLQLREFDEGPRFGRWYLRGVWSWAEVVTLRHGVYVGGDVETVVFSGHPNAEKYGARSPLYWMATRSYRYAAEKADRGRTQGMEWDRDCALAELLYHRRHDQIGKEEARQVYDCWRLDEGQHAFAAAVYEATGDCELCSIGEVVSRRVFLATAILRRLTGLIDLRKKSTEWFRRAA